MQVVRRLRPQSHDWLFQGFLRRQGENVSPVILTLDNDQISRSELKVQ